MTSQLPGLTILHYWICLWSCLHLIQVGKTPYAMFPAIGDGHDSLALLIRPWFLLVKISCAVLDFIIQHTYGKVNFNCGLQR